ncbi:10673_t:CDS:1 [Entrophospora sp. SA101]|nr:5327_t:CDS:1 [Entrophospora sp. SA101]CAJ0903112.1 10673_t:CDS:1 [Entrophospora sp. SA101]
MANVHTLQDISSNKGHRLGSMREQELEESLHHSLKSISELNDGNEALRSKYMKRVKAFDQEKKRWNQDSLRNNTEIEKLRTHTLQVINEHEQLQNENTNLISHNAQKDIFIAESKAENTIKSKKIRSLESMIEILKGKLSSAQEDVISIQNDSLKKESENLSLKSKIAELENIKSELESKVNELEHLKSEAISKPIVGGSDEKNITKSDNISLGSTDLSKYFIRGKNMDQIEKIDGEITELPKNDTKIDPEVNDEISISEINKDNMLVSSINPDIPPIISENMTPHLAQREINMSSLIESNSQMRPGPEALPPPIGAIPIVAYIFLTLLIIAVMWFVRHTWGFERKSDRLRDMWARY